MNTLRTYLNSLPSLGQAEFAARCGTTIGFLRKAISVGQKLNEVVCVAIEQASRGAVTCESLRPDLTIVRVTDSDWPHPHGRPLIDYAKLGASETAPERQAA